MTYMITYYHIQIFFVIYFREENVFDLSFIYNYKFPHKSIYFSKIPKNIIDCPRLYNFIALINNGIQDKNVNIIDNYKLTVIFKIIKLFVIF